MDKNKKYTLNRRESLKSLVIGGLMIGNLSACKSDNAGEVEPKNGSSNDYKYGRTAAEKQRDETLIQASAYFTQQEIQDLGILVDLICPADEISGSASEAGVIEFIDFIVKDMHRLQLPLRSGLAWLNRESQLRFQKPFTDLIDKEQKTILDDIAFPGQTKQEHLPGEKFFSLLRNLTLTGFYTSKIGLEDLGYQGNRPNFWDGVPEDVLKKHGLSYEEKYLEIYITEENRSQIVEWNG